MTDQIRGFILSAIAALAGWSGITSVGLLMQVSSLQATSTSLENQLKQNDERDQHTEDKILLEILDLRTAIESNYGRR